MNKEFVTYEEALALKKLGFDEPTFVHYTDNQLIFRLGDSVPWCSMNELELIDWNNCPSTPHCTSAPLYQQAFRWFRENHNLHPIVSFDKFIDEDDNDVELDEPYFTYYYSINELWDNTKDYNKFVRGFVNLSSSRGIMSQEEAELACLKKLIEILNQNKNE